MQWHFGCWVQDVNLLRLRWFKSINLNHNQIITDGTKEAVGWFALSKTILEGMNEKLFHSNYVHLLSVADGFESF